MTTVHPKIAVENLSDEQLLYYIHVAMNYNVVSEKLHGRSGPRGEKLFRGNAVDRYNGRYDDALLSYIGDFAYLAAYFLDSSFDIEYCHDDAGTWEISSHPSFGLQSTKSTDFDKAMKIAFIKHQLGSEVDDA